MLDTATAEPVATATASAAPSAPNPSAAPAAAPVAPVSAPAAAQPAAAPELPKWLSQVSPELRGNPELHGYQSLNDAAKALLSRAKTDARTLVIPDPETATKEEMSAFRKTMGIPDIGEDYPLDLGPLKGIPEVEKLEAITKKVGAASGLTRRQAQVVLEGMAAEVVAEATAKKTEIEQAQAAFDEAVLKETNGDSAKAEAYKNLYKAALIRFNDAGFVKILADSGKLYDPKFAKVLATMEAYMGSDQLPAGESRPIAAQAKQTGGGAFGGAYSEQWANEGKATR